MRGVSSRLFTCLYVCIYVFMCPCVRVDFYMVVLGLVEVWGSRGEGGSSEWLVHGQACSQRCVGKKTYQKIGVLGFNLIGFSMENCILLSKARLNITSSFLSYTRLLASCEWANPWGHLCQLYREGPKRDCGPEGPDIAGVDCLAVEHYQVRADSALTLKPSTI